MPRSTRTRRAPWTPALWTFALIAAPLSAALLGQTGGSRVATARTLAETGVAAASWDARIAGWQRAGALRLRSSRADTMLDGRVHDRFAQYIGDARILGGDVVRQRSADGTETVFGTLVADVRDIDVAPTIGRDYARARFTAAVGQPLAGVQPELVLLPETESDLRLAWLDYAAVPGDVLEMLFDARSGAEIRRRTALRHQSAVGTGTGVFGDRRKLATRRIASGFLADDTLRPPSLVTFDLKGNITRTDGILNGSIAPQESDIAVDADNAWTDGAVVDAHAYVGFTYDYYFQRFGRRGLDGLDRPIRAIVHPIERDDILSLFSRYSVFYANAFWCGVCGGGQGLMMFGEGFPEDVRLSNTGARFGYASGSLDVVAHELTHGVVSNSSNLDGGNEPGALNEAFADMMAVGAEFHARGTGRTERPANYVFGEDWITYRNGAPNGGRSLENPARFGYPDHYANRYVGRDDDGGVHFNAGIPGQAFYLAIEGGVNRTSGIAVQGVGAANRDQIERVFYRGFTAFLTPAATFVQARQATLRAASELYGESSAAYRAVQQAWTAVGVD